MDGITVAHTGGIEALTVVVDSHRTVDDLVAAVTIDISHAKVVVALAGIVGQGLPVFTEALGIGVEDPVWLQFLAVPVPGSQYGTGVVAPAEEGRGSPAVEVSDASQKTVGAVGIVVAPVAEIATLGDIGLGVHSGARQAVEDGDVFVAGEDTARHRSTLLIIFAPFVFRRRILGISQGLMTIVGQGVADDLPHSISGSIRSTDDELGLSVTVEIVEDERDVVGTATDIDTQIDTPE